jgi:hypothetical protein
VLDIPFGSPYYSFLRKVKYTLGQRPLKHLATAAQMEREAAGAGLQIVGQYFVLRWASQVSLILFRKL